MTAYVLILSRQVFIQEINDTVEERQVVGIFETQEDARRAAVTAKSDLDPPPHYLIRTCPRNTVHRDGQYEEYEEEIVT